MINFNKLTSKHAKDLADKHNLDIDKILRIIKYTIYNEAILGKYSLQISDFENKYDIIVNSLREQGFKVSVLCKTLFISWDE